MLGGKVFPSCAGNRQKDKKDSQTCRCRVALEPEKFKVGDAAGDKAFHLGGHAQRALQANPGACYRLRNMPTGEHAREWRRV